MFKHVWLYISNEDLEIEKTQLVEEGKDISSVKDDFQRLGQKDLAEDLSLQKEVKELYDRLEELPVRDDYSYEEPSLLAEIKKARPAKDGHIKNDLPEASLRDKLLGAWLGRCSGCLLGKPVEGWKSDKMWPFLKETNNVPLQNYFYTSDIPEEILDKYDIDPDTYKYFKNIDYMPEDDDTNYTVTSLAILKKHKKDFTPRDVANFWLGNIPLLHTCTAERVAYKNFSNLVEPPRSARYQNPYREWIGAQIRGDVFGYVNLGNPERAAEFAWRDASISHVKNGIYGEMWVAAMLAVAPLVSEMEEVIRLGLAQIPEKSRLTEAIQEILDWYREGIGYREAISRIHDKWDEYNGHHWCHTISNAQIVAFALLWGEKDFEKSICRSVEACFDTDCNGATVGSIVGMMLGAENLPEKWIGPLNDELHTGIQGYTKMKISELVKDTFVFYKEINKNI